jgi:hypothetical protein
MLCEAAANALEAVTTFLTKEATTHEHTLSLDTIRQLVEALQSCALPRLTDVAWATALGGETFSRYMHCCTQVLTQVSSCILISSCCVDETSGMHGESSGFLACLAQWVETLLQLASSALQLTKDPHTPSDLRAFYLVNITWKELVRVASDTSTGVRDPVSTSVSNCFQVAFATAWQHLLVRSRYYYPNSCT